MALFADDADKPTIKGVALALGVAAAASAALFLVGRAKAEHVISTASRRSRKEMAVASRRKEPVPTTVYYALEEELVYRGALLPLASSVLGPWGGLAATSALFGLAHGPGRIVDAGLGGLAYGSLYTVGKLAGGSVLGIFASTAAHTAHNLGVKSGMSTAGATLKKKTGR